MSSGNVEFSVWSGTVGRKSDAENEAKTQALFGRIPYVKNINFISLMWEISMDVGFKIRGY